MKEVQKIIPLSLHAFRGTDILPVDCVGYLRREKGLLRTVLAVVVAVDDGTTLIRKVGGKPFTGDSGNVTDSSGLVVGGDTDHYIIF